MKLVRPSTVKGEVAAPPSKSMMVRTVAAALLADGSSRIVNPSYCDDGLTALAIIEAFGARIASREKDFLTIRGTGGPALNPHATLDCGESGLCMRMFAPIAALLDKEVLLLASGSLHLRPMGMVEELAALRVSCETDKGHAPVKVRGPMRGGHITIDGSLSSQFLTGLLMTLPLCEEDSVVSVSNLRSAPYVLMTVELLKHFGVEINHDERLEQFVIKGKQRYVPSTCIVEGDWSGASFLLVAGAITGSVTVTGLNPLSAQADRAILEVLELVGASIEKASDAICVERRELKPFEFDATDCPDLFPPLVALASSCEGKSVIRGLERLAHKESDRARALVSEFSKLGIVVTAKANSMEVHGGNIREAVVDAHNDHRIAMACAVAALRAKGNSVIKGEACVSKSYPDFFSDLETLGEPR
jgi:3-phosphoshikimate 1-carboxyvinyltransferase